jgi:hypothetical protein
MRRNFVVDGGLTRLITYGARLNRMSNRRSRGILKHSILILLAVPCFAQQKPDGPEQPIPYSHKQHLALGLTCKDCHTMPAPGDAMGFPASSKCMACHQTVKKDSPAIQKLAAFDREKQPIPWVRIYRVADFVTFSHQAHLKAGAQCENCHGPVAQRDRMFREVSLSMSTCVQCHREHNADQGCEYCHDAR